MWRLKMKAKNLVWRFVCRLLWWLSENLRHDYLKYRDAAWNDQCAAQDFGLWLSGYIFDAKTRDSIYHHQKGRHADNGCATGD